MKKNKMMRLASVLLVLTLLSTSVISGTFAKYTTSVNSEDSARVAKWGFKSTSIDITDLFSNVYYNAGTGDGKDVVSADSTDVIAPGTTGFAKFGFVYGGDGSVTAPEVDYTFVVNTAGSECATSIQQNPNIQWKLDDGEWGTWSELIAKIEALDGNKYKDHYEANSLPDAFKAVGNNEHTITWQWLFETDGEGKDAQNVTDTAMGNAADLADVKLVITITATQVD